MPTKEAAISTPTIPTSLNPPVLLPGPAGLALAERPPLTLAPAAELAEVFKVLANDARLRLLHAIARHGEIRAGDLAAEAGLSLQAASNQLQRLVDRKICATRRAGTAIYYRIIDPCVLALLHFGLCLVEAPVNDDGPSAGFCSPAQP